MISTNQFLRSGSPQARAEARGGWSDFVAVETSALSRLIDDAMVSLVLRVVDPHEPEVDEDVRELGRPAFDALDT